MRARRLALAVESQTRSILVAALGDLADRDANVLVVLAGMGCGARPQPRSSKMPAADTRAAGGTASWLTIPASTLMHSSVCPRASERKVAICSNDAARSNPPHILERANNKSNVQHSTAPHLTCYRKSVRNCQNFVY